MSIALRIALTSLAELESQLRAPSTLSSTQTPIAPRHPLVTQEASVLFSVRREKSRCQLTQAIMVLCNQISVEASVSTTPDGRGPAPNRIDSPAVAHEKKERPVSDLDVPDIILDLIRLNECVHDVGWSLSWPCGRPNTWHKVTTTSFFSHFVVSLVRRYSKRGDRMSTDRT